MSCWYLSADFLWWSKMNLPPSITNNSMFFHHIQCLLELCYHDFRFWSLRFCRE
jgi:hypothetical protein